MSDPASRVRLDLNNPVFQAQWFSLEKKEQVRVLQVLRKLSAHDWRSVQVDRGLRWEAIHSKPGPKGARLHSLRLNRGFRAIAYRDGDWMRFLSLHPDNDSAYGK
jgi:hypothetical protein